LSKKVLKSDYNFDTNLFSMFQMIFAPDKSSWEATALFALLPPTLIPLLMFVKTNLCCTFLTSQSNLTAVSHFSLLSIT